MGNLSHTALSNGCHRLATVGNNALMGIFVVTALLESSCISVYTAVLRYSCLESAPPAHHCQQHLSSSFFSRIGFLGWVLLLFLVASPLALGKSVTPSPAKPITAGLVVVDTFKALTLEQTLTLVMEQNPKVKALQAQTQISKAQLVTANARLNPSIMSDNGVAEKTYRLGVQQTFELGGKRNNRVAVANAQQAVTGVDVQRQLLDVRAEVRKTYTQVFNLQERQAVTEEIMAKAQQLLEVTEKREKAGDVATLDVLQAEIVMVNARNELQLVAYQVVEARNRLNTLLNQPLGTSLQLAAPTTSATILTACQKSGTMTSPVSPFASTEISVEGAEKGLVGWDNEARGMELGRLHLVNNRNEYRSNKISTPNRPFSAPSVEEFVATAANNRPEIQQNLNALTVVEKQLALAKSNRIPNLTIATGFDKTTGEGGQNSLFAMGNLEIPLLNRQEGPIQEALAKKAQLEVQQQALKNELVLEVTNAHAAVQAHQQRVANYETQLLPKAHQLVEKARRSFEEGKVSVLTPINAQQAFINNHLGYLQAMQDLQNAISDLERAIGVAL